MAKASQDLGEALQLATARFEAFTTAAQGFTDVVETIDVALGKVDQRALIARRQAEISALLPKALAGNLQATQDIRRPLDAAVSLATQRRDLFQGAADDFASFAEQAGVLRQGRRGQRNLLTSRRTEIAQLLGVARGGGEGADDAITQLRKLLPETLALGQSTLSGGRLRALASQLEQAGTELNGITKDQVDLAEQQLAELRKISEALTGSSTGQADAAKAILDDLFGKAGALKTVAEDQRTVALATLVTLGRIADAVALTAATKAAQANADIGQIKNEISKFREDIKPTLAFLKGKADQSLGDEFERIVTALGSGGDIVLAINRVAQGLGIAAPGRAVGGDVTGGRPYVVGERGPELFIPQANGVIVPNGSRSQDGASSVTLAISGPVVFNFPTTPRSQAEASEYGRTAADAFTRRVLRIVKAHGTPRKVA